MVLDHARAFVEQRLAPAAPPNDGKQTPYRGHPVFIAQHATACCCRGCLQKWHGIPKGRALTPEEMAHVLNTLERWLARALLESETMKVDPVQPSQPRPPLPPEEHKAPDYPDKPPPQAPKR